MTLRNLKRLRLLCGLTQFELSAGSDVSMHRIRQAEQRRIQLSEMEESLILEQLRKHWEWMNSLDPEGARSLTIDVSALTSEHSGKQEPMPKTLSVMTVGVA